jgi:hypothetical protein
MDCVHTLPYQKKKKKKKERKKNRIRRPRG